FDARAPLEIAAHRVVDLDRRALVTADAAVHRRGRPVGDPVGEHEAAEGLADPRARAFERAMATGATRAAVGFQITEGAGPHAQCAKGLAMTTSEPSLRLGATAGLPAGAGFASTAPAGRARSGKCTSRQPSVVCPREGLVRETGRGDGDTNRDGDGDGLGD